MASLRGIRVSKASRSAAKPPGTRTRRSQMPTGSRPKRASTSAASDGGQVRKPFGSGAWVPQSTSWIPFSPSLSGDSQTSIVATRRPAWLSVSQNASTWTSREPLLLRWQERYSFIGVEPGRYVITWGEDTTSRVRAGRVPLDATGEGSRIELDLELVTY